MGTDYNKWANYERDLEPDPEDIAREKLRKQKENMSEKEIRRLHDCWEEPEFRRMFEEYQEEVTDPKHRAETEEYLMQCEAEQRAGKQGVRLRLPRPPRWHPAACVALKPSRLPARRSRSVRWTLWTRSVLVERCRPRAREGCRRRPRARRVRSCSSRSRGSR